MSTPDDETAILDLDRLVDECAEGSDSSKDGDGGGNDEYSDARVSETLASTLPYDSRLPLYEMCSRRAISASELHRWQTVGSRATRASKLLHRSMQMLSKYTRRCLSSLESADGAMSSQMRSLSHCSEDPGTKDGTSQRKRPRDTDNIKMTAKRRMRNLSSAMKHRDGAAAAIDKSKEAARHIEGTLKEATEYIAEVTGALGDMRSEAEQLLECFDRSQFAVDVGIQGNAVEGPYPLPLGHLSESIFDMRSAIDKDDADQWERTAALSRR